MILKLLKLLTRSLSSKTLANRFQELRFNLKKRRRTTGMTKDSLANIQKNSLIKIKKRAVNKRRRKKRKPQCSQRKACELALKNE